jgi:hypothetical protein
MQISFNQYYKQILNIANDAYEAFSSFYIANNSKHSSIELQHIIYQHTRHIFPPFIIKAMNLSNEYYAALHEQYPAISYLSESELIAAESSYIDGIFISIEEDFKEFYASTPDISNFFEKIKCYLTTTVEKSAGFVIGQISLKTIDDGNLLFTWVTVDDKSVCEDCKSRQMKSFPYREWLTMGVPRSCKTSCLLSCRCILLPFDYVNDTLDLSKPLFKDKYIIRDGINLNRRKKY